MYTTNAGAMPAKAPTALMSARRELAVTSSVSSVTRAGTSALLAIALPFWSTSTPKASGIHEQALGCRFADVHGPRKRQSSARPAADAIRKSRRPPFMRSSVGSEHRSDEQNGVIVIRRKSSTLPRAALVGLEKKSEPAIDTMMHASPHAPTACA